MNEESRALEGIRTWNSVVVLDWEAIQRLGFPIVLVIYLFTRFEPLLRKVLDGQEHLRTALYELRMAQLLYIIGHPSFSKVVKEQADIDAEVQANLDAIKAVDPVAFAAMTALDKAKTRVEVLKGKNIHSVKAEKDATDAGHAHGASNKTFHDSNPHVFGHGA